MELLMKTFKRFMGEAYSRSEKRSHSKLPPKAPPVPMPNKNHYVRKPGDVKYNMPMKAHPNFIPRYPDNPRDIGSQYKYNPTDNFKLKV